MNAAAFSLVFLFSFGPRGGVMPASDYDTLEQCQSAKETALLQWKATHHEDHRVKFNAECVLIVSDE